MIADLFVVAAEAQRKGVPGPDPAKFEKLGIVWNVVRVSPERQRAKSLATPGKPSGPRTAPS